MDDRARLGITLRLVGPVVEIVGLSLFLVGGARPEPPPVLGMPVRLLGTIVLAAGLGVVVAGLALSYGPGRRPKSGREDMDLRL
jgi:hypothetical protein